jgi:dihydrodipicolinate synthase/N-acetylneuraminate lyase
VVEVRRRQLPQGCYITVPTLFADDDDLTLNIHGIRRHIRFLLNGGISAENSTLLAGGAAGDFSTMTYEERLRVAEAVKDEAAGRVPVAMGAQTTSTLELRRLAKAAERLRLDFIQVSCPFYFNHTEEDFFAHVAAAADAADVGIILYNTFWTSAGISETLLQRLSEIPNLVALKWAVPRRDSMEFEAVIAAFGKRYAIIDNSLSFVSSHIMGVRAYEVHLCNYWPEWGVRLVEDLNAGKYAEVQKALVRQAMPFYQLWLEIEANYTSGDGYLDKLCMELVGLPSSRCRPPTRDIRRAYREAARAMLIESDVPNVQKMKSELSV